MSQSSRHAVAALTILHRLLYGGCWTPGRPAACSGHGDRSGQWLRRARSVGWVASDKRQRGQLGARHAYCLPITRQCVGMPDAPDWSDQCSSPIGRPSLPERWVPQPPKERRWEPRGQIYVFELRMVGDRGTETSPSMLDCTITGLMSCSFEVGALISEL
ncbi:hypothetical protein BC834DRAFT_311228 [Gloeopeniophorella convolvens]|nr:hypothetical protein BC834DRAFT_311228 [Gloeopeniophorella convolvens]